ncbi:MAG: NADP-dependent glyceraldehyde-3-phosphate dehydrogenase [cyanobacterium endosymbiont of Rhopalodia musculus]|uniref:NADP-dependent glyceraldehyde-3-phosphate dehydrogenase n=1 Tax=cyanobacterium endosymbiont of Epithemia clementina EcSB TaxID=3034674 RepID=UPI00248007AD|nr:NADP-dependent glyceraldehyde-3-phosphate dehydrogenase [cyanobacterium endosymbiont of Epithemia clementina EcSB]WGT67643.1 NADP-dependent glyceraldehyde-3-phosphate dehydrogenase [cyanobacterium endosymbiont of Epithemia clementina EcSB]
MSIIAKINNIFPSLEDIPPEFQLKSCIEQREYLINGNLRIWNEEMEESLSPIFLRTPQGLTRQKIGNFPSLGEEAALSALDAAAEAYDNGRGKWPTMSVGQRIECLQDFAYRMKEKRAEVVNLLMWEIGKSYTDSCKEFDRTVDYIEDTIDALKNLDRVSSRFEITQGVIGQIRRAPLGIVLSMGPANYPLNETFTTLIPALIMGNTVVVKAPRPGVLLNYPLLEAFKEAFPPGVVNTIYGKGRTISPALMESGKIDALAFIGSSKAANNLKKQHPKSYRLRSILGLEAKNPGIILPHADLDLAVKECILGTLSYNGQRCTAIKILFVHTAIVDKFLNKFIEAISNLKFGMPWEEGVFLTPIAELGKPQYLKDLVEDAKKHGADVINEAGGTINETFFYPAVLYPVNEQMKVYSVEQFGPVIPIVPFDDIETPIDYLVQSDYGQQVSIFGQNTEELARLVDPLVNQVCRVNLNSQCQRGPDTFPFTGRKDSAEGTLSVHDALRAFSIRTLVAAKEIDLNKQLISEIVREHKSNFLSTDFIL